jgi:exodeoxyribonuclease V gamma subunit
VSYSGRGIRDNAPLPPSMLIAELRDALDATAVSESEGSASEATTVHHRLQPFSARYFDGSDARLYSHAAHYAQAAIAAQGVRAEARPFITQALAEAPPELLDITPQQFVRFFRNPAEYLLRHRLGIHLEESEGLLETVEPFVPQGLERYTLRTQLVEDWQVGVQVRDDAFALARARGALPHGEAGAVWFGEVWDEFAPFAAQIAERGGTALPPCRIDLQVAGVKVQGSLGGLQQCGDQVVRLDWRVGDIRPMDKLTLWLNHVLLHAAGQRCESLLLTPAETWSLPPLAEWDIETLCAIYKRGCSELLPFFPATSLHWLAAQRAGKETFWRKDWEPSQFNARAECLDAYVDLAWRECDPFDQNFEFLAGQIYGPLLEQGDAVEEEA